MNHPREVATHQPSATTAHGLAAARAEKACPVCAAKIAPQPRGNRCPECRRPLNTNAGTLLPSLGAEWLRAIAWGPLLMAAAVILHGLGAWIALHNAPVPGSGLNLLGAGLFCFGIWLLTPREESPPPLQATLAILSRVLSTGAALLWIGVMVLWSRQSSATLFLAPALLLMAAESITVGMFASSLASRIPHAGLANQFRNFAYFLPPLLGLLLIGTLTDITPYAGIFFLVYPAIGALAGLLMWVAVTCVRFFLELRKSARASDELVLKFVKAARAAAAHAPAQAEGLS